MFSDNQKITNARKATSAKSLRETPHPDEFCLSLPVRKTTCIDLATELNDIIGPEPWFLFESLNLLFDWQPC